MKLNHGILRKISVIVAVIGLTDSIYLTWIKLSQNTAICSNIGDCEAVNNSIYSEVNGIPIALLGAGAYGIILGILLLESRYDLLEAYGNQIIYGITMVGFLYSVYLTYLEIYVLRAICPFCVVSAVAIFILFLLSIVRLVGRDAETYPVY